MKNKILINLAKVAIALIVVFLLGYLWFCFMNC